MSVNSKKNASRVTAAGRQRPLVVPAIAVLLVVVAVAAIVGGILLSLPAEEGTLGSLQILLTAVVLAGVCILEATAIKASLSQNS